ncbi:hypothetical protein IM538_04790 [Cytobacillus suaedae]|nr:hypothetical protein IM538_04790 [Cytobacillus suaedae]
MNGRLPFLLLFVGILLYGFSSLYPLGIALSKEFFYLLLAIGTCLFVISGRILSAIIRAERKKTG